MKCLSILPLLVVALGAVGCGSQSTGPRKPEETPVVTEQEIQEAMTKGMPPNAKAMYDKQRNRGQ
jgi:hypothetical protein